MIKVGILARLEAKPGKEKDVEQFLKTAISLAREEDQTIHWFAFKISRTTFGVFDTFESESGKQAHLNGKIAAALMAGAAELLASPPVLEDVEILTAK